MERKNFSKISIAIIAILAVALVVASSLAVLQSSKNQGNSVTIIGINLDVSPSSVTWDTIIEGTPQLQNRTVTLNNTKNTDMNVYFSDDLAVTGLTMLYPDTFLLPAGSSTDVYLCLNYTGEATYGDYAWTITIQGVQA